MKERSTAAHRDKLLELLSTEEARIVGDALLVNVAAHGYRKPGGIVVEPNVFVMTVAVKPSATKQALGFLAGIAPALA